ncbi:MAG: TonB-dependent receptor domain-containing protein [Pontibacterium sp.]
MSKLPFKVTPLALVVSSICASNAVFAQDVIVDETLTVWGTEVTSSSSLLAEDITVKQADHLSDLLRDQAGVDVGGSHSMVQGINIRGVDELDLNITIDGASQNNNMFHHSGNLLINSDILKSVDVSVGSNSVASGGLSGGAAFETKDAADLLEPGKKIGARLHTAFGSNKYLSSSATVYGQLADNVDAMAYIIQTDKSNPVDGNGDTLTGNEGTTTNGLAKLGWDVNEANRLELSYDKYADKGDYYSKTNFGTLYNDGGTLEAIEYLRETVTLNHELDLGDDLYLKTALYQNTLDYDRTDSNVGGLSVHTGFNSNGESLVDVAGTAVDLRYGAEGYHQTSEAFRSGVLAESDTADAVALYVEGEFDVTENLSVTPGLRYDYHAVDMTSAAASNNTLDTSWNDLSMALAAKYFVNDQWTLQASATELFQGPGLRETYVVEDSEFDPNLKAETGVNTELGLAFSDAGTFGFDQFDATATVFKTRINDYIDNWSIGKTNSTFNGYNYGNLGDVDITGVELTLGARKGAFDAKVSYSSSESEIVRVNANSTNYVVGDALRYDVGDSVAVSLGYDLAAYNMTLGWTSLVTFDRDGRGDKGVEFTKEGYDVHSLSAQWKPQSIKGLTLTAGVENIFNEQFYSHASYARWSDKKGIMVEDFEAGRNYKLTASYAF